MTNKEIQETFVMINERFFDNKLPFAIVRFKKIKHDGIFNGGGTITINKDLTSHSDLAILTLIHEMVHLKLHSEGYVGWEHDGGHHTRFYAEIDRLYKIGAFEGIL